MPMHRRLPKRGFTPLTKKEYALVNLCQLEIFEAGSVVDAEALLKSGLISAVCDGIKVLATGELTRALTIKAHKFSASAREKIQAAGGTIEEI